MAAERVSGAPADEREHFHWCPWRSISGDLGGKCCITSGRVKERPPN
jgi:hypothetical protein